MSDVKIKCLASVADFDAACKHDTNLLAVVHFYASWAPQCQQIDDVLTELKKDPKLAESVELFKVEAESMPEISDRFNITAVPTCVLLRNGSEVDRVNGVKAAELSSKVMQHALGTAPGDDGKSAEQILKDRLEKLVNTAPVMVFMKGSPEQPRCGFSRTLVELLQGCKTKFSTFDILSDETVRQGLKEFSNWPTYPQVYVKGVLVGGLDIVKELIASGEFFAMLPAEARQQDQPTLDDRLRALVNQQPVMLFMKGSPSNPQCGFSKSIVAILSEKNAKYGHFDILSDEEVRQGLKTFSSWPTYPQLYVKGELIGGLDIVKELNATGELETMLKSAAA